MIQFNLLPDVKIAFIKAQRQKQLVMTISFIASGAAITLFMLLYLFVHVVQHKSISDLTNDIKDQGKELTDTPNLNKMLTVQNQLAALERLHADKVVTSRLFPYLQSVTPTDVKLTKFTIDFAANTVEVSGEAPSLAAVNAYADSFKYATYITKDNNKDTYAFTDVVLASFGVSEDKGPQFKMTLNFDPTLFQQDQEIKLKIQKDNLSDDIPTNESLFQKREGQ